MNILFIVVLAAFWAIGGIIKATQKKPDNSRREPSSDKPLRRSVPTKSSQPSVGRPTPASGPGRPRAEQQPAREATAKPRSRLEKLAAEFEKSLGPYISESSPDLKSSFPKSQPQPVTPEPVDVPENAIVNRVDVRLRPQKELPETELPELVLDYTNPDELTKAILYYEILGPPMSLREPSYQIGNP